MLGWAGLAGVFALWQFQTTLRHDPEAAQSRGDGVAATKSVRVGLAERFYRLPSILLGDPLGVLMEKEVRYTLRSARFRLLFLMSGAIGLAMAQTFNRSGGTSWGPSFLTPANAYTLLMMGEICIWNIFGFDRGAAQMFFVAPVQMTRVLMAKNLNAVLWIGMSQATVTLACIAFRFPVTPKLVLDAAAVTAVVLTYFMSAGNYMSVSNPRPADPESAMRSRSAGGVQMLLMLLLPVAFIPAALAYFARWAFDSDAAFFGVLGVMGAIGAMVYSVALESTAEHAGQNREKIVTALAAGQGPISS